MTRFGEISPLWQNFTSLWQIFDSLFLIWPNVEPTIVLIHSVIPDIVKTYFEASKLYSQFSRCSTAKGPDPW